MRSQVASEHTREEGEQMSNHTQEHERGRGVAIYLDFENLIYGLIDRYGEQGAYEHFKVQRILDYASKLGPVMIAKAYADWRVKSVNRFQTELYTRGIELVHVLGRGNKNAVDMKMATDMVEHIFTHSHVDTVLLCSGDRDFLPVLSTLKRYGRQLASLAPQRAMSTECKRLCDQHVTYESLLDEPLSEPAELPKGDLSALRAEVIEVVRAYHPRSLTGAQLKQHLLHSHGGRFDERDYGYVKLGDLVSQFEGDLIVKRPPQGDISLSLSDELNPEAQDPSADEHALKAALGALRGYQYSLDAPIRRRVLREIYQLMRAPEGASWTEVLPSLCDRVDISRSQANKYHAILLQSQAFEQIEGDEALPVKQRPMTLDPALSSPEGLIERYEQSVLLKVASQHPKLNARLATRLLGLSLSDQEVERYVSRLLEHAQEALSRTQQDNT